MRKAARDFCPEEWKRQAEECQSGSKTVKAWREENGVTPRTYYYRLSKARGAACPKPCMDSGKETGASGAPVFAEIGAGRSGSGDTAISLKLGGAEVEIHN